MLDIESSALIDLLREVPGNGGAQISAHLEEIKEECESSGKSAMEVIENFGIFTKPELLNGNRLLRAYSDLVSGGSESRLLIVTSLLIMFLFIAKNLLQLFIIYLQAKFSAYKEYELGTRLYDQFMRAPYKLHLQKLY